MLNENEECYILFGRKIGRFWIAKLDKYTLGDTSNVEFDPDYVFNNRSKVVGWVHTHPVYLGSPSATDNATTKAWVCSLGKPLVCCIHGVDGLRSHWYMDDESSPLEGRIRKIGKYMIGVIPNA